MSKQSNTDEGIGRRTYLKASAAAGAAVSLGASVPTSVTAASGSSRVRFIGRGVAYELTAASDLAVDTSDELVESGTVSGRNAEGVLDNSVHSYLVSGNVTDLRIDSQILVFEDVTLLVGGASGSSYEVTVDGSVTAVGDTDTQISGGSVEGTLGANAHRYVFDGAVVDVRVDGQAAVIVID